MKNEIVFEGYLAELIRLQAEKAGITPEAYILSFFEEGCNAPDRGLSRGDCLAKY